MSKARQGTPQQLDLLDWLAAQEPSPVLEPAFVLAQLGPAPAEATPMHLTRVDLSCNMRRFYGLELVISLWGVVRQWGRIGSQGQRQTDWHDKSEAARAELKRMAGRNRRRGYR